MEYLRADRAVIVDAETGAVREIDCKETANALYYELQDMEEAVKTGDRSLLRLQDTCDVTEIMTWL